MAMSDDLEKRALELVWKLDEIARNYDSYRYGLPMFHDAKVRQMVNTVTAFAREVLAATMPRDKMRDTLTPRERQIVELLLQGYETRDMAKTLGIANRSVKQHLNNMYDRYGIDTGVKRVKLAVLIYKEDLCLQDTKGSVSSLPENEMSSAWSQTETQTGKWPTLSEPQRTQ